MTVGIERCRKKDHHDAHEWSDPLMFGARFRCEGVTEQRLHVTQIRAWTTLRDEIAPALARQFPGCIVTADECVVTSTIPDPEWQGASLTVLGIESRTVDSIMDALIREHGWELASTYESRNVNHEEAARLEAHRMQTPRAGSPQVRTTPAHIY